MKEMAENHLVIFKLNGEEYGVPIAQVKEIVRLQRVVPVPEAPPYMMGIINLRGIIIPVIDLKKRFKGLDYMKKEDSHIIIVDINQQTAGMVVDSVEEVARLSTDTVEPPPFVMDQKQSLVEGIGKLGERFVVLLNLDNLLSNDEQEEIQQAAAG